MTRGRDHRRIQRWLSLDLDGRLEGERRVELEAHVGGCPECRQRREALLLARAEFEAAPRVAARAGFADRVLQALQRDVVSPWLEALPLVRALATAALAVCVVSVSLLLVGPSAAKAAPELPMGPLNLLTRRLFETGSVPRELLPPPRAVEPRSDGR